MNQVLIARFFADNDAASAVRIALTNACRWQSRSTLVTALTDHLLRHAAAEALATAFAAHWDALRKLLRDADASIRFAAERSSSAKERRGTR